MDLETFVRKLRGALFTLALRNGEIICRGAKRPLTDEERVYLKAHKAELKSFLLKRLEYDLQYKYKVLANAEETYRRYGQDWPDIENRWREERIPQIKEQIAQMEAEIAISKGL